MKTKRLLGSIIFAISIIVLWQLLYVLGTQVFEMFKPYAVPSPMGVLKSFASMCADKTLFVAIGYSIVRALIGFVIAIVLGIMLALLILKFPFLERNLKPIILGIQTLPSVCFVPFAILWFGLNNSAIIFVVVMGSAFGIALSICSSIKNVPPIYVKAAKTMGAKGFALYTKVIFPAALPAFIAGLRHGWSFAWRALMSGEVMSATAGLGFSLMLGRDLADINQVMTIMVVIVIMGIVIDKLFFSLVENHLLKQRGLLN